MESDLLSPETERERESCPHEAIGHELLNKRCVLPVYIKTIDCYVWLHILVLFQHILRLSKAIQTLIVVVDIITTTTVG